MCPPHRIHVPTTTDNCYYFLVFEYYDECGDCNTVVPQLISLPIR